MTPHPIEALGQADELMEAFYEGLGCMRSTEVRLEVETEDRCAGARGSLRTGNVLNTNYAGTSKTTEIDKLTEIFQQF